VSGVYLLFGAVIPVATLLILNVLTSMRPVDLERGILALATSLLLGPLAAASSLALLDLIGLGWDRNLLLGLWLSVTASLVGLWWWRARQKTTTAQIPRGALRFSLVSVRGAVMAILLVWLVVRLLSLLVEVWWLPVSPWDAWVSWALRAKVWFYQGEMVPFAEPHEWLEAVSEGQRVWMANGAHYPPLVPLIQVWQAVMLGRFDDRWINLPWLGAWVSVLMLSYALARQARMPVQGALVVAALVASLPMLDVHAALAGYADLWQTAAYLWLLMLAIRWSRAPGLAASLMLLLGVGVNLGLKLEPGPFLVATAVPVALAARLPLRGWAWGALAGWVALAGLWLLQPSWSLPFGLGWSEGLSAVAGSIAHNLWILPQWHLLWFLPALMLFYGTLVRSAWRHMPRAWLVWLLYAPLAFAAVLTSDRVLPFIKSYTVTNRALLYLAPAMLVATSVFLYSTWRSLPRTHCRNARA